MDYGNAARFLNCYNKIESQLKLLYNERPTQNFTDLVKRCTDRNLTVRRYENELVDYGKLRNAIVHRTGSEELFIANPSDEVVETIEFIAKQLCDPPRIADAFKVKPLAKVFADKPLLTAVEEFAATCKKSIVVYDHGKTAGVLNTYYVFRLIAERAARGESVTEFLKNTPCGDVLDARQLEHYVFLSGEATVFDVFAAFERQKELYAVIVTENGTPEEKALLVLTPSDFPAINRCLEAYSAKTF